MNFLGLELPERSRYGRVGKNDSDTELTELRPVTQALTASVQVGEPVTSNVAAYTSLDASLDAKRKPYSGWRTTVLIATGITTFVLLVNLILIIVAVVRSPPDNGIGVLYSGDCDLVKRWNTALHIIINLLSTCLLGASSYTMQCLASPTRSEVDAMHARRKWMDIGLPSLRNIFFIKRLKAALWMALCISTLPLHLFFNSTVFSTISANKFSYIVADESFLNGASYLAPNLSQYNRSDYHSLLSPTDVTDPAAFLAGYKDGNFTRLSVSECLDAYNREFVTSNRNFIAITSPESGIRMSPGDFFPTGLTNLTEYYGSSEYVSQYLSVGDDLGYIEPLWNGSSVLALQGSTVYGTSSRSWLCRGWIDQNNYGSDFDCSTSNMQKWLQDEGKWPLRTYGGAPDLVPWAVQAYDIRYCLSETKGVQTCELQYVSYIMTVVILCNVIKAIAMALTAAQVWNLNEPILATIGDAMDSFLRNPDPTTKGHCLMSFSTVRSWSNESLMGPQVGAAYNRKPTVSIYSLTTKKRWWVTMVLCFFYLIIGYTLLGLSLGTVSSTSSQSVFQIYGLGAVKEENTLRIQDLEASNSSESSLLASILVANSFQLVLSITYFLFNSLWTAQCAAKEWATYATSRKPLRVTWPRGEQRSTHYLSLPYQYGVPLLICLALLHFLISQSIFLARVQYYGSDGSIEKDNYISDAAFSPLGILCTVCVATTLLVTMLIHSFFRSSNIIPPHGNTSLVISAMCHPVLASSRGFNSEDNTSIAEKSVQWGVPAVEDPTKFEYETSPQPTCTFSAGPVRTPTVGAFYY